ncbi:MAG: SP_1767 family glycosyltransferase [Bacteroidaceae bacterium]|nr:SP_1767 family glycosyltransferase [Bacteroidaceae bacterium]
MKKLLVDLWNWSFDQWVLLRDKIQLVYDFFYRNTHKVPKVASIRETILYILDTGCSVSRFGDAEMKVIHQDNIGYQTNSNELTLKLLDVLNKPIPNHITCLIDAFDNLDQYDDHHKKFLRWHLSYYRKIWYQYLLKDRQYYNAFISRCYLMYKDKSHAGEYFDMLKQIWAGKNILLVEGLKSRLGVGNDLFADCKQIKRILGPQVGAFSKYDDILTEVLRYPADKWLVILALGPTATVLAYDLAQKGYQAIDIGNVDTEYEWYKMGALTKVPIPNKYVHEAGGFHGSEDIIDKDYQSQIVKVIN